MRTNWPAPAITGVVGRITVVTSTAAQTCFTSFDYMSSSMTTTTAEMAVVVANFLLGTKAHYLACLTPDTTLIATTMQAVSSLVYQTAIVTEAPGVVGTVMTHSLPLEMGATLTKYSAIKGQHGRGRVTMPAVPITFTTPATDPNRLNATGLAAYLAVVLDVQTSWAGTGGNFWAPVISTRPKPPASVVAEAALVTQYVQPLVLGTARRRKEGRGI